jgi:lipopolysaccharide/colanic/teichoic acid biosynthesis glycosyltransferase
MDNQIQRRHSKWHEIILFNRYSKWLMGFLFVVVFPVLFSSKTHLSHPAVINSLVANALSFLASAYFLGRMRQFIGCSNFSIALPTVTIAWLVALTLILLTRVDYSRSLLLLSFGFSVIWVMLSCYIGRRYNYTKLALVPFGRVSALEGNAFTTLHPLTKPSFEGRRFDGVVVDLRAHNLPPEWEKFLAQCALANVPVYHYKQLAESLTGKVNVEHLSENLSGNLQPSRFYMAIKRVIDTLGVFVLLPILAPILIITAIAIRLESKGNAIFIQERVGFNNKLFKIYKFRSMRTDMKGTAFTSEGEDPRITRVGKIIRKYRIDELPQVLNILKGEMSFIGPRPESKDLAYWYEQDVPFFSYRHIVRPGISGWAQVKQGYAAEIDGMKEKLEYDLYYIKYFSFHLDILVTIKTIKTILTGFGAR